jgi:hypothetical protein
MLLDIGAKTSNLLFFDKDTVYARGINIGANSITADFSKESKLSWDEAEAAKIDQGFVSLGGAYEEPEDPNQQAISKIARQVMTRLHIQVNQTIQFYRGQQGGAAPVRLFLSGGASTLPYTAQFFAEKLNLPVEYFNPLRNVQIDPAVNIEELVKVGHQMGELVGLGLRNLAHCPIELNLMPKSSLQVQQFSAKKPYLIATMACLVAILFAFGYFYDRIASIKQKSLERLQPELQKLQTMHGRVEQEERKLRVAQGEAVQIGAWLEGRVYWGVVLNEVRDLLIKTERDGRELFKTDTGIWIEKFQPDCAGGAPPSPVAAPDGGGPGAPPGGMRRRGGRFGGPPGGGGGGGGGSTMAGETCSTITVLCRGLDLSGIKSGANDSMAFLLKNNLTSSSLISSNTTLGEIRLDNTTYRVPTFTVQVNIGLEKPLKL